MATFGNTPISKLEADGRLFDTVFKGPTTKPGRFGFRGDIALAFQQQVADEARPPDYCLEQVLVVAQDGDATLPIIAGYLHNYAWLKDFVEVMGPALSPTGTYIMYCNNIDLLSKYRVSIGDLTFIVLPLDESTVWKEVLELMSIDKNDIKKLDTAGKLDYVLDAAMGLDAKYEAISYEKGLEVMLPVRNRNENRPV